jgi:hypothetical protein
MGLRGGLILAGLLGLLPVSSGVAWSSAVAVLVLLAVWLFVTTRDRRPS